MSAHSETAWALRTRPHERIRRYRFGALRRCCASDYRAKRKTSDNLPATPLSAHRSSEPVKFRAREPGGVRRVGGGGLSARARKVRFGA